MDVIQVGTSSVANNGQKCLDMLESKKFDLILMDMQMPVMDGVTATKLIRTDPLYYPYKGVTIVGLTANVGEEARSQCLDSGMNDYVTKPIRLDTLEQVIKQVS